MVPLQKKFCTSEARKPFFVASSCSRYHLIVLRILCFGYSLRYTNERTNERTNEIMGHAAVLSSTCGCLSGICVTLFCAKEARSWSGILCALRYCSIAIIITLFEQKTSFMMRLRKMCKEKLFVFSVLYPLRL